MPPPFPGRILQVGSVDPDSVTAVQRRLNQLGCGPVAEDGEFGAETRSAVKLFQARFTDFDGLPLKVDGRVGVLTWGALFGTATIPLPQDKPGALLTAVLDVAVSQIGVLEAPLGSNRGTEVDEYLRAAGVDPAEGSFAWCMAFVYFCFEQAADKLGRNNPAIRTAGVLDHWRRAGTAKIPRRLHDDAAASPALVQPGMIFMLSTGGGHGHTGLVEKVLPGKLMTIEGNTNPNGSPEGIGVFRREGRKIADINLGFVDYSGR